MPKIEKILIIFLINVIFLTEQYGYAQPLFELNTKLEIFDSFQENRNSILDHFITWNYANKEAGPYYLKIIKAGDALYSNGNYDAALDHYSLALPYIAMFNKYNLAILYLKVGNAYKGNKDYESAIQFYVKGLEYIDMNKDSEILKAKLYTNIANIFAEIVDFEKALSYLNISIPIFRNINDSLNAAIALASKARILNSLGNSGVAFDECLSALNLVDGLLLSDNKNNRIINVRSQIVIYLASYYIDKNESDSVIYYLTTLNQSIPFLLPYKKTIIKLLYGNAFAIRKEKTKAILYMQQSLSIAQKNDFKDIILAVHRSLANLYNAYGDFEKAWEHGHQYINLQQNLFDETKKNINSINALESKYQLSLKDNELMQRELLITRQEKNLAQKSLLNIILTSSALGAFTLALLIFIFYRNYKRKQQLLIQKKEIAQLKEIMKAEENERSRLARELHDGIGSMLAAVKMNLGTVKKEHATLAGIHQLDTISHMLEDTSSELRKAAHNLMPDVLNKHHLEDALLLYFSQMNVTNELKIDLHCHGNLNQLSKSQELVLYRIVQELIQNILKHAEASKVEIQLMQYGDTLALTVEDNGKGFDVQEYNGGFGLQNLRYRIQSLHGSMHITSVADKNTTIYIEFDLKKLKFAVG